MAYVKTLWNNGATPLSAENMNHIEEGIETLDTGKVDKVTGKGLSTNDYTTEEKTKLTGISASAKNIQVVKVTENNISIESGTNKSGSFSASQSGWTLVGVVGFYLEDSSPAVIANTWQYIEVNRLYVSNNTVYYSFAFRNTATGMTSAVKLNVYCLYIK